MAGLEGSGGDGHRTNAANDLFSMFFGGGRSDRGRSKGSDVHHAVKVSLDDVYNGKTCRLAITRKRVCRDCQGHGGLFGAEKVCAECRGHGVQVFVRHMGPGMIHQMQTTCTACGGRGKYLEEKDKCRTCQGAKVLEERKVLEAVVEKGMGNGSKIKFSGEADEFPGVEPGDVVLVLQVDEHARFKRKNADLFMSMEIELSEALCGLDRAITHLDQRRLRIQSPPGSIVCPDAIKVVSGEGMPLQGNIFTKGNLFIRFIIRFPPSLSLNVVSALASALPPSTKSPLVLKGDEESCAMVDSQWSEIGKSSDGRSRQAYEDEDNYDEQGFGGQRVQCAQS